MHRPSLLPRRVTKDKTLGTLSNLIGNNKSDIYSLYPQVLEDNIIKLSTLGTEFYAKCDKDPNIEFIEDLLDKNISFQESYRTHYETYIAKDPQIPTLTENITWFLEMFMEKKALIKIKNNNNELYYYTILYMRQIIRIIENNPWLSGCLKERNLVKKLVMASAYGLTRTGGIKAIKKFIGEYITLHNLTVINKNHIYFISKFIEGCFTKIFKSYRKISESTRLY